MCSITVSVFDQVTSEDMAKEQGEDPILGIVCPYATAGEKLKISSHIKIKSKAVRKYLLQFDRLTFKH